MSAAPAPPRVLILGCGFAGLTLGMRLRRAGLLGFTILEKEERLGGTWRDNTYPGAACDVPSFLYSFSFAPRSDWPRKWSGQSEILAYLERCAEASGVLPHVRFGTEAVSARFDEEAGVWRVRTREGEILEAEVLVSALGQLHKPVVPPIPGLEDFAGPRFHSARWRHDVPLAGRRVGVVGNAASAVQLVPEIAPEVERLTIFQRTPNWVIPRGDLAYGPRARWAFAHVPGLARLYRAWIWARAELLLYPAVRARPGIRRLLETQARRHLEAQVPDPELRRALTPDYPICGKRVLISDDYYPALTRENVSLETAGIERVTADGVVDRQGRHHPLDVLVLATGFDTTTFVSPVEVEGRGGRRLETTWKEGASAYLGLTVSGFPNFFLLYGPNTNLGHNSIVFMIECQVRYVLQCLERLRRHGLRALDLRPEAMEVWERRMQEDLRGTAWDLVDRSWYKNEAGRITNNWPWSTFRYWWETRRVDWSAYREVAREDEGPADAAEAPRRSAA